MQQVDFAERMFRTCQLIFCVLSNCTDFLFYQEKFVFNFNMHHPLHVKHCTLYRYSS